MARYYIGSPTNPEDNNSRLTIDPLSVIYSQAQWRLSRVSALHDLQYSVIKLKQYASKIKQSIVSTINSVSSIKYSVKVEAQPLLKFSEEDADTIIITVTTNKADAKSKTVFEGILLSWGLSNEVPNAIHLPYMLDRGEQKISTAVKLALGTIFDCRINQYTFTVHQLLQFGFHFVEHTETYDFQKNIGFSFNTPKIDFKDKLTINFEIGDICNLYEGMKEDVSSKSDLVNVTYQLLQNQIFQMFEIDITALDLCEVSIPKASVKNNGIVKMKTDKMVNCMFSVLNDIS